MNVRALVLLIGLILLTKPDGEPVWIVPAHVVAVLRLPGVGAAGTAVVTLSGTFFVREKPEDVVAKLK